jgi:hypothetical protein
LFSPFFAVSVSLAHLALSRNKQNSDHPLTTKVVALTDLLDQSFFDNPASGIISQRIAFNLKTAVQTTERQE